MVYVRRESAGKRRKKKRRRTKSIRTLGTTTSFSLAFRTYFCKQPEKF
jgi:hypothetical protein